MKREEAIKILKELHDGALFSVRNALETLIPELAETEDDRIRTFLHHTFIAQYLCKDKTGKWHGEPVTNILAYLENQKEQKPTAEEILAKAGLKPYKDGNQWCILVGDNIQEGICGFGDTIDEALYQLLKDVLEKQKEPLPVPDKFSGLKSLMLQYLQSAANRKDDAEIESDTDLFGRKILDYVWKQDEKQKEQKPAEWSEEDVRMLNVAIRSCEQTIEDYPNDRVRFRDCIAWLKSLRPQPNWKPSEEQMHSLSIALDRNDRIGHELYTLYNDLKKLM